MRHIPVLTAAVSVAPTPAFAVPAASLPGRMTAWSMFMSADWVVKGVMIILIVASIATWAIFIARYIQFQTTLRAMKQDQRTLDAAKSLSAVTALSSVPSNAIVQSAKAEVAACLDIANAKSSEAMTDRLSIRLAGLEGATIQSMRVGLSVLASIGATSPFIGLFGTVWGIMNSFIGISQAQTTNLAVVAPGIAEALLATAFGLVAAIPAVLLYNVFSRRMAAFRRDLHNMTIRVVCLVSHEVEIAQVRQDKLAA